MLNAPERSFSGGRRAVSWTRANPNLKNFEMVETMAIWISKGLTYTTRYPDNTPIFLNNDKIGVLLTLSVYYILVGDMQLFGFSLSTHGPWPASLTLPLYAINLPCY